MLGAPRLDLLPVMHQPPDAPAVVHGAQLRLLALGPVPANAAPPVSDGPVDIVFSATYLKRARNPETIEVGEFAKLTGVLEVVPDAAPIIRFPEAEGPTLVELQDIQGEEHPKAGRLPPLSLHLEFGTGFLRGPASAATTDGDGAKAPTKREPVPEDRSLRLRVPGAPERCPLLEIHIALQRSGAPLAEVTVNGCLDVNLILLEFLAFRLETPDGQALADAEVEITLVDGTITSGTTEGDGRLALNGVPAGDCSLYFPGHAAVVVEFIASS